MNEGNELRRHVPSVDKLLRSAAVSNALARYPRWAVLQETRNVLDDVRSGSLPLVVDQDRDKWIDTLGQEVARRVASAVEYSLKTVINATGVVLHTNLGRALLAERAIEHVANVARRYSNLELDLSTGERGSRYAHVEALVCEMIGAEAAIVVNNNAAAVMLCLTALAVGREVVISRGELVEIGGSFRIPDVMRQSGATLIEVGTTNRTHLPDYERAVSERTALLLKVHTSNYRIIGFTSSVPVSEMVALARKHGIAVMHDLGAGCLVDLRQFGLPPEPTVKEAIAEGADLVTFSGDKLLGGPQIGVIAGRAEFVKRLKKHQMLRALRVDKLTLAAFEATLRTYRDATDPTSELPSLRMLAMKHEELKQRASKFAADLTHRMPAGVRVGTVAGQSQVGAGSAPEAGLATELVTITPKEGSVQDIESSLRHRKLPVMVRVYAGDVLIDLRTVATDEEKMLLDALEGAVSDAESAKGRR